MAEAGFSKGEAIRYGWETIKRSGFLVGVSILAILVTLVPGELAEMTGGRMPVLSLLFGLLHYLVNGMVFMGMIRITLDFVDKKQARIADLFSCIPQLISYVPAAILYFLITLAGFILLIVPGVIWGLMFFFYAYFIVDRGSGPIESFKMSAAITKGAKWELFLFMLLILGINILGILALVVGLLVTIPLSLLATAHVYRQLMARTEGAAGAAATELPKVIS